MNVPKVRRALKRDNQIEVVKGGAIFNNLAVLRTACGKAYQDLREGCREAKILPNAALRKAIVVKEVSP